jgi:hypothetical protein
MHYPIWFEEEDFENENMFEVFDMNADSDDNETIDSGVSVGFYQRDDPSERLRLAFGYDSDFVDFDSDDSDESDDSDSDDSESDDSESESDDSDNSFVPLSPQPRVPVGYYVSNGPTTNIKLGVTREDNSETETELDTASLASESLASESLASESLASSSTHWETCSDNSNGSEYIGDDNDNRNIWEEDSDDEDTIISRMFDFPQSGMFESGLECSDDDNIECSDEEYSDEEYSDEENTIEYIDGYEDDDWGWERPNYVEDFDYYRQPGLVRLQF